MPPTGFAYDVFLSHSSKDKPIVRQLAERLRDDGLHVWFDEWAIPPGGNIPRLIDEGLEQSASLILFMSANSLGSDWLTLESQTFRFADPVNRELRFIPLRLDDTQPRASLRQFAYIDWRDAAASGAYARLLSACRRQTATPPGPAPHNPSIPAPPAFYPEPSYASSHQFTGRRAELELLSDWSTPADPNPILLFDAIGGAGKSMLTWHWATRHQTRTDWAGIFWYSFYERRAVMADFCRHALAYISGQPLESFNKLNTPELARQLLPHLTSRPWLFILDGLERVLVAYHDLNPAELPDEAADRPTDPIANRDPRLSIRPEDDELLRALATAGPSKILVSSRLVPRVLINPSGQAIPGVKRIALPGLRPPDAETLLRSAGVTTGNSVAIQAYLQTVCDCHPLTIGVIAGLIVHYLPAPGNFDRWSTDPDHGGDLNLANLDLIQRRTHIVKAAIDALPAKSRQLLTSLALLSGGADYETLAALNPHLPPDPPKTAQRLLQATVQDLKSRGLLQFDTASNRHDLHPVVRGVASGALDPEEKELYGGRILDIFNAKPHSPWEQAQTLEDLEVGLEIVRTLLNIGRYPQAADTLRDSLSHALLFNLEASAEYLRLLRPFFRSGWQNLPTAIDETVAIYLANDAGIAWSKLGDLDAALQAHSAAIRGNLSAHNWPGLRASISNVASSLPPEYRLPIMDRLIKLASELASLIGDPEETFRALLDEFCLAYAVGDWSSVGTLWASLDSMGRSWSIAVYRSGDAESLYAWSRLYRGDLDEETIFQAKRLAHDGNNRPVIRGLHRLSGLYFMNRAENSGALGHNDWTLAAESFHEAVHMARKVGQPDAESETLLTLAKHHLGQLEDGQAQAARLASLKYPHNYGLAKLYLALGDRAQAEKYALIAYTKAWHDGGRYVYRYDLNRAQALLDQLGVPIPKLPTLHRATAPRFPWEAEVEAAIAQLRAEKSSQPPSTTP